MAKKKGKKGKGKGAGKKDKKKGGLTNQERQIFLQTIDELKHKIQWRNHMCDIIDQDLEQYREAFDIQKKDKDDAVKLLEDAILEQRQLSEKVKRAIPDAENFRALAEEQRSRDLALKLRKVNEEKLHYDAQLDILRNNLKTLETYDKDEMDRKIKTLLKKLEEENADDTFIRALQQQKRRENAFREEMLNILNQEADSFQDEIGGKLDKKFERIAEETRWWADTVSGLRIASEHLASINDDKSHKLQVSRKNLERKKEISLRASYELQEGKAMISDLVRQTRELEDRKEADQQLQNQLSHLGGLHESLKQRLKDEEDHWMEAFRLIRENESEIEALEEKLIAEMSFGNELYLFIKRAQRILAEEAKYSLILTYDGPPEPKKTLEKLSRLFEVATKFIYERGNKSVL